MTLLHVLFVLVVILPLTSGFAAQGHWELSMSDKWNGTAMKKSMYRHSKIAVNIHCEGSENASPTLRVQWRLYYLQCSNIIFLPEPGTLAAMQTYWGDLCVARYEAPVETITCTSGTVMTLTDRTNEVFAAMNMTKPAPANLIPLTVAPGNAAPAVGPTVVPAPTSAHIREGAGPVPTGLAATNIKTGKHKRGVTIGPDVKQASKKPIKKTAMQTDELDPRKIAEIGFDGIYVFTLQIESVDIDHPQYNLTAFVWMKGPYGYLSVIDWPLLPFYGTMCVIYIVFGLVWFVLCACNWRDLLRIQLWIGAIIVLGMLEKAVFFAEYESLNVTGHSVPGAVVFAELVSCVKRALARMLVVIISIGFGIVKPRLGPMLHRIVGMGVLYFILASVESCMRALQEKSDESKKQLLAAVPLAVLDATICWWIFTSLVQVMRTLRLRRNLVKLSLYRHFTNTLIFAVIASIGFMAWTLKQHKVKSCISDWKELWVDDAFWHLLFSVILMVIMVLWRPTNTNQRYAFSAISDTMDEQDEAPLISDAFDGMKMRGADTVAAKRSDPKAKTEDDLKWIEENIPASVADVALPSLLDSDEEVMTTKFEMSKME